MTSTNEFHSDEAPETSTTHHDEPISRRGWGKGFLLGATALGVLFASSTSQEAQAAPVTDNWKLGGNAGVSSDGTNFIGPTNSAPLIFKTAGVERMRVHSSGNIGIGVAAPSTRLQVEVASGMAILARHTATTGDAPAIRGETSATVANASGVYGWVKSTAPGTDSAGVRGENASLSGNGVGVRGNHAGDGIGVFGTSKDGYGVQGTGVFGVYGVGSGYGVFGISTNGYGVYGYGRTGLIATGTANGVQSYGTTYGVYSESPSTGVYGSATGGGGYGVSGRGYVGVYGTSASYALYGDAGTTGTGVYGVGDVGVYGTGRLGVRGNSTSGSGVYGTNTATGVPAVYGVGSSRGVQGTGSYNGTWGASNTYGLVGETLGTNASAYAVWGQVSSAAHFAGYFKGKVHVEGTLSKGSGAFKIDHPLDPANKYLYHSFVESPDMKNIYDGVVVLDARGEAVVTMPNWFEALNMEFRYQLTCIGGYAPVYIADEIESNRFKIAGGKAGMKVSWQVTGVRQDAFANANRIPVEEQKPSGERGKYLHPEAFGKPAIMSVARMEQPAARSTLEPEQAHPRPKPIDQPTPERPTTVPQ